MDHPIFEGDEAWAEPHEGGRRKTIDRKTFTMPIRSLGLRPSVILDQETTVQAAVEAMRKARIGSVVITGDEGRLTGIFTERDVLNVAALGEMNLKATPLRAVMRKEPEHLTPDD